MNHISHWINGAIVVGTSGRSGAVFNPATGVQTSTVDFASVQEIDAAVAAVIAFDRATAARENVQELVSPGFWAT